MEAEQELSMEAEDLAIREWLDGIRRGWGAKWGAAFEAVGLDMAEDLEELDEESLEELTAELKAVGAKTIHIKKMIKAIRQQTAAPGAAQPGQQARQEVRAAVDAVAAVDSLSRPSHTAHGGAIADSSAAAGAAAVGGGGGGDAAGGGGGGAGGAVANTSGKRFCAFLSHHKAGAAMEARWIKGSMESRLGRGARQAFLDSDDLNDLNLLMSHVRDSDVLCLLQTAEVLLRPFCILELNEAIVSGVPIVALSIRGKGYDFADMATYMARGQFEWVGCSRLLACATLSLVTAMPPTVVPHLCAGPSRHRAREAQPGRPGRADAVWPRPR